MYNYQIERPFIFTEEGQVMFLSIRDRVHKLLNESGAVSMWYAIKGQTGETWAMMACVDRLVELKEIKDLPREHCPGQLRIFVKIDE